MNKLIVPWEKSVVPGCLFLLVMVMAVGAYVGIKEEERAFNPVYQEQKTAGPMVNRAVGAAMEKYLDSADPGVSRVRIYSTTVSGDGAVTAIVYVSRLECGGVRQDDSQPHEMTLAPDGVSGDGYVVSTDDVLNPKNHDLPQFQPFDALYASNEGRIPRCG